MNQVIAVYSILHEGCPTHFCLSLHTGSNFSSAATGTKTNYYNHAH